MSFLRKFLDSIEQKFRQGKLPKYLYPIFEATDTFLYTPNAVTQSCSHIRDAIDLKRTMLMVVFALVPSTLFGIFNVGYQANLVIAHQMLLDGEQLVGWRYDVLRLLGIGFDPNAPVHNLVHGFLYFLPIYLVTLLAGGAAECLFAMVRHHEINEGFLVTSALIPLVLPPTMPLWQVGVGTAFGIVLSKEVFGGTGMNILNPALTVRALLFFAYPARISGDSIWVALDGYSMATPLLSFAGAGVQQMRVDVAGALLPSLETPGGMFYNLSGFAKCFWGLIPGSIGETSTACALIGALILILSGIGSWRVMLGCVVGLVGCVWGLNLLAPHYNSPMLYVSVSWHLVVGGFAFGAVFMATDPVSAACTDVGRFWYGVLIGVMCGLIRVINPAYPEGMMLAILFANVFAPLIDHFVVEFNVRRRRARDAR